VLGTGATLAVIGGVTGVAALNKKSDLDEAGCDSGCPAEFADDIRSYRRYRTVSYVGLGLGVVGLGWGGYLVLQADGGDASIALQLDPLGASLRSSF
jgi:hypothetical protein